MMGNLISVAVKALAVNRLRTLLSTLGLAIGIASSIAMVSIARGSADKLKADVARLGGDIVTLSPGQSMRGGIGARMAAPPFDRFDLDAITSQVQGIRRIGASSSQPGIALARGSTWQVTVMGTGAGWLEARRLLLSSGRLFSDYEEEIGKSVCLLGAQVHRRLFGRDKAIGEHVRIKAVSCEVIGVIEHQGQSGRLADDDNLVAMPLATFQRRIAGKSEIHSVVMSARPGVTNERLVARLESLMRERRGTAIGADDFSVVDLRQVASAMAGTARTTMALLGAVAITCLLLGGVGIMNVMLAAVNERTREIGIMLAVGATPRQIRTQMLIESALLSLAGGILGAGIGTALAVSAAQLFDLPVRLDLFASAVSVAIALLIGLAFGYAPASKAARLDPIEALQRA